MTRVSSTSFEAHEPTREASVTLAPELVEAFRREISGATSVLIGTHLNPDGDALGCAMAVAYYLAHGGIPYEVVCHHAPPVNLQFIPGVGRVKQLPSREHDLGIVVDLDSLERLGSLAPHFAKLPRLIVIDHHVPHDAPGDVRIVDTHAPATAVILARLFCTLGVKVTPEMATCLLTGIVTDTGSFRFRNTTAEALSVSAKLVEAGGNINLISEEVFQRKPLSSARLLGYLLERMSLEMDDRLCYGVLDFQDFLKTGADDVDTEGFVNELLSIRTVEIAAIFREPKPGRIRVSLRSRGDFDVAAVAREIGGGGHRNAAGCSFEAEIEEALELVLPRLRACLASS